MELRFSLCLRYMKKNGVYGDHIHLSVAQYDDLNCLSGFCEIQ